LRRGCPSLLLPWPKSFFFFVAAPPATSPFPFLSGDAEVVSRIRIPLGARMNTGLVSRTVTPDRCGSRGALPLLFLASAAIKRKIFYVWPLFDFGCGEARVSFFSAQPREQRSPSFERGRYLVLRRERKFSPFLLPRQTIERPPFARASMDRKRFFILTATNSRFSPFSRLQEEDVEEDFFFLVCILGSGVLSFPRTLTLF